MRDKEILLLDDNLFFSSAVCGQLEKAGMTCKVINPKKVDFNSVKMPGLAIVNLNSQNFQALELIPTLKESGAKVLGFCGHGQTILMQRGQKAGCDWVIPNSVAAKKIVHFLKQQNLSELSAD